MKIIQYFLSISLVAFFLSSCIKDNSVGDVNPISKIEMDGELKPVYSLEQW